MTTAAVADPTPLVSVVIETITARYDSSSGALADDLQGTLAAIARQKYPHDRIETIVVLDERVGPQVTAELASRYPSARFATSAPNYFAAKNAGAMAARGSVVALLDGDCVPEPDWLDVLVSRFEPAVPVVAGRTRYTGRSVVARTFSVPDFANVLAEESGEASGFNINNVAFRRDVLLEHPFEDRIRRNGGCYLLYHQLRAAGVRVVYEPRAVVQHGLDVRGLGFVRKHFDRGYDGVGVYRVDQAAVLRGTRIFRSFGGLALIAFAGRRIVLDWRRLGRQRRQIGISVVTLPYFATIALATRLIELVGGLVAVVDPRRYS